MEVEILANRKVVVNKLIAGTQNENNVTTLTFTFPEAYEDFDKKMVFITSDGIVSDVLEEDTYTIKRSITKYEEVYCYISFFNDNDENFRSKEFPLKFYPNHEAEDEVTEEEASLIDTLISTLSNYVDTAETLIELEAITTTEIDTIFDN